MQVQKQHDRPGRPDSEEVGEVKQSDRAREARERLSDVDDLLDDIDALIDNVGEDMAVNYRQAGGE